MGGLNKDRKRSKIVNFRVSHEERSQIEARVRVLGLPKGEYFMRTFMVQPIEIIAGQYQSNRLSLEIAKLTEQLSRIEDVKELSKVLSECKTLLNEMLIVCGKKSAQPLQDGITADDE